MKTLALLLLGALLVGAYHLWRRGKGPLRPRLRWPSLRGLGAKGRRAKGAGGLRRRLLELTSDPAVAERLVHATRQRHPGLGEAAILRRVIKKLERDRR